TVPTISWPMTRGSFGSVSSPSSTCRSVRQTPQARTRRRSCSGPGRGRGRSASRSGCRGRSSSMARMMHLQGGSDSPFLLGVAAHELALCQNVAFHGRDQLVLGRAGGQVERRVQGVELEEVAVRFAARRGRASVAGVAEVVLALPGAAGEGFLGGCA